MEFTKEPKIKIQLENNSCKISYDNITDDNDYNECLNKNININSNLQTDQSTSTKKYNYPTNFDDSEISLTVSHTSKNENSKNISLLEITDKSVFFADNSKNYPILNKMPENKENFKNFKDKKIKTEQLNVESFKMEKDHFTIEHKTINKENNRNNLINKILHNFHTTNNQKKCQLFSKKITKQIKLKLNLNINQMNLRKKNIYKNDIINKNALHLNNIINNNKNLYSENKINTSNKSHISLPSYSSAYNNSQCSYYSGTQRNTEKHFFDRNLSNSGFQKIFNINKLRKTIFLNQGIFLNTDNSNTNISNSVSNTNINSTGKTSRKSSEILLEATTKKLFSYLNSGTKNNCSSNNKRVQTENKVFKNKTNMKKNLNSFVNSCNNNIVQNKKSNINIIAMKNGAKMGNNKEYRKKANMGIKKDIIKYMFKLYGEEFIKNGKQKLKYCKSNSSNWKRIKKLKNILGNSNK